MNFQMEGFGLSSSSNTYRLIRKVMYGMLLYTRWQKVSNHSMSAAKKQQDCVKQYDRQETPLTGFMVSAVLPRCIVTQLHLNSV